MELSPRSADPLFRAAFLSAGHGMAICALDGTFIAVNPALCAMLKRDADELHGLRFQDITHPDDLAADLAYVQQLLNAEIRHYEMGKRYLRRDGSIVSIQLNVGLVRGDHGSPLHFIAHMHDLTTQNAALAQLEAARGMHEAACIKMIQTIASLVEKGDPYTAGHQGSVAGLAKKIAEAMGLPSHVVESAHFGGLMHDVGKIYVPSQILSKPGHLTDHETALVREHPTIGYDILVRADLPWPTATVAHQHHERMNGDGYPSQLRGPDICLEARIVAVADVYDAIASFRPYRAAFGSDSALAEIESNLGGLYDPDVVMACASVVHSRH